ncbi:MAG: biotin/lipoyl-binding protein [Bacillota bacterium]|nr:biotin/lipoyl-binding protein [Bacillota bacterium]
MIRRYRVRVDGQEFEVEVESLGPVVAEGAARAVAGAPVEAAAEVAPPPRPEAAEPRAGGSGGARPAAAAGERVVAPLPGVVLEVRAEEGQRVEEGDVLCVLEAMKMENEITAPVGGTVAEVAVRPSEAVNTGDLLFVLAAG